MTLCGRLLRRVRALDTDQLFVKIAYAGIPVPPTPEEWVYALIERYGLEGAARLLGEPI